MKKTVAIKFSAWAIIIALFITYSASSTGLILCISEFGHFQIESKISINFGKNDLVLIDNTRSNVYLSPISGCGNCEDIEFSQAGLIRSSTQRNKAYYQATSSIADTRGSREFILKDDYSNRFIENLDLTRGHTQDIISMTILIC